MSFVLFVKHLFISVYYASLVDYCMCVWYVFLSMLGWNKTSCVPLLLIIIIQIIIITTTIITLNF